MTESTGRRATPQAQRSTARLNAVQALYQVEQSGIEPDLAADEFIAYGHGRQVEEVDLIAAYAPLFRAVVEGAAARRGDIDPLLEQLLAQGRGRMGRSAPGLTRLELLIRCILRAACWELMAQPDTPAPVIIDDYVEIAFAFYAGPERGLVNAVLDQAARRLRPQEFGGGPEPS